MSVEMDLDFELLAYNIRCLRMARSYTQAELAELSGVDKSTIHRLETGLRVRLRSLEKISAALSTTVSFLNSVLPYGKPENLPRMFVHRRETRTWFATEDRRKKIPPDSQTRIQNEAERLRLGRLGLVTSFQAYAFAMPNGPGMSESELFGCTPCGQNEAYEDCVAFCVRGEVVVTIGGEPILLKEGDGVGYRGDEVATIEPAKPVGPNGYPPIFLFVTANRRGHLPIEFHDRARRRTRHKSLGAASKLGIGRTTSQ